MPTNIGIDAIPGETIMPAAKHPGINYKRIPGYYIWRTQNDSSVRLSHIDVADKIFHKNDVPPPVAKNDMYGCRCYRDYDIPDFVRITSKKVERKDFRPLFD